MEKNVYGWYWLNNLNGKYSTSKIWTNILWYLVVNMRWAYYGLFVVANARPPRCFVVGIFGQTIAALKQDPSVNMDNWKLTMIGPPKNMTIAIHPRSLT